MAVGPTAAGFSLPPKARQAYRRRQLSRVMKLLFLINGSERSAAAHRADAFIERLPRDWTIQSCYRPARKWKGIPPFARTALRFRPDIVYVMDTAYTGVLAGCLAQSWTGCRLVTDTGDAAYELAKSSGTYSRGQLALIRWNERLAMRRSDCVVVRGSYHKELLEGQGVRRVAFLPDGVDLKAVTPVDAGALRAALGLAGSLVVGVIGTMAWSARHRMCYGWDAVEALGLLKEAPVKALLVGDGDGRALLEARARELGVADRIIFAGAQPFHRLPEYIGAMDACLSTQSNDVVGRVRTTGKLPLYLACGKYVIASDVGEASRVLPGVGCLLPYRGVRDEEHPARVAQHLRALRADPGPLRCTEQARQIAADHFDYDLLAGRLERLCCELVSPSFPIPGLENAGKVEQRQRQKRGAGSEGRSRTAR